MPEKVRKQKSRRLSGVQVVCYSRWGEVALVSKAEMKARASGGVREKRIIRGCSGT